MTDITSIAEDHVREAMRLADGLRALNDAVVRTRPDERTAAIGAQIFALLAELEPRMTEETQPWSYSLVGEQRETVNELTGGDRASVAGRSWTSFNPVAPPVETLQVGEEYVGTVQLGVAFAGPPGRVHGGTVATLLDHAMGALLHHLDRASFTAHLGVDYVSAAPLHTPLELRARVERVEGRKTYATAELSTPSEVAARATGLFLTVAK